MINLKASVRWYNFLAQLIWGSALSWMSSIYFGIDINIANCELAEGKNDPEALAYCRYPTLGVNESVQDWILPFYLAGFFVFLSVLFFVARKRRSGTRLVTYDVLLLLPFSLKAVSALEHSYPHAYLYVVTLLLLPALSFEYRRTT